MVDVAETIRVRYPDGVDAVIDVVNRDKVACAMVSATVRDGGRVATTVGAADIEDLAKRGVRGTNVFGMPTAEKLRRSPARSRRARSPSRSQNVPARRDARGHGRVLGGQERKARARDRLSGAARQSSRRPARSSRMISVATRRSTAVSDGSGRTVEKSVNPSRRWRRTKSR